MVPTDSVGDLDESAIAHAKGRLGTTIRGKYRLDRILGIGGMAVVYAATHRNQQEFAVKMLHAELSLRQDMRSRFLREGYVANSVKHPGAVKVIDDDVADDGAAFLVMELLEGAPVEELAIRREGTLPLDAVLALAHGLLDILASAHAKAIIHRDIKPANIFITNDGAVKVLDFGIARLRDSAAGDATHTGMLMGTPAFMAPEQALGEAAHIDGKTDLWAVGAMMFTLLSGNIVHPAPNAQQIMIKAATQNARSLATTGGHFPEPIVSIVDRALQTDKENRFDDAAQMRDAVRVAYEQLFGERVSSRPLTALFADTNLLRGPTVQAEIPQMAGALPPSPTHPSDGAIPVSASPSSATDHSPSFEGPRSPRTVTPTNTTNEPVATEYPDEVVLPTTSPRLGFIVAGLVVVVAGVATVVAVRTRTDGTPPASAGLVMTGSSAFPSSAEPAASGSGLASATGASDSVATAPSSAPPSPRAASALPSKPRVTRCSFDLDCANPLICEANLCVAPRAPTASVPPPVPSASASSGKKAPAPAPAPAPSSKASGYGL